ncbi:unnamed protein product (macronuclear) [Paramecium tetraurelia]|uniref:Uncharacterized protein n=1 Tax=Paramecium tetraurelia TaxID=5888 RepID=A0E471_PARTE|nr:uncharacterized protein GSPATT00023262001 [Paramecium tetraurelia]CAK90088.1 unnamed protein product [Paramecium tetraurelia]|eukprot:XP_001457485.1 hypothetical protein (macronuclear) [Paramecium tetraurelia strain d4-2]
MEIPDYKFNIQSDKPSLHEQLRAKLNPFQVKIVSCENLQIQAEKSYELCYFFYIFYIGTMINTNMQVQRQDIYFNSTHIFYWEKQILQNILKLNHQNLNCTTKMKQ